MTVQTAVTYRCMLKDKWPALFGVTLIAGLVDRIGFKEWIRNTAMGIVAIDTGEFALQQRHVGDSSELGPLFLMAGKTGFIDAGLGQQAGH